MKKITSLLLLLAAWAFACKGDEIPLSDLPDAIQTYIETNYPDYSLDQAEQETLCGGGSGYELEIEKGEEDDLNLTFDADGVFLFVKIDISISELPAAVLNSINTNYDGFAVEEPAKLTLGDGTVRYQAELEKGKDEKEVQFDAEGVIICEKSGD